MKKIGYFVAYAIMICALVPTTLFFLFHFAYVIGNGQGINKETPINVSLLTGIIIALLVTGIYQLTKYIKNSKNNIRNQSRPSVKTN